ncbi:hypothetical protein BD324DRAFT_614856 [Kockovaella imperatae]|uniref:non-specific serine/threonine protein kinase n=1 Tax=Kockovaella imperatae TaxID=4999 RepID=A0A1Y1UNY3_9TREE|nr:hypothetical protein BD324DRAFT_614856 [Kockovaella imperatae]ORX39751.1 hypothetical protein BD324DRAFT_614856 [Kockovaella imperatae]
MNLFLILSHILAVLLPFFLLVHASPSPDPAPAPAIVSLPPRPSNHGPSGRVEPERIEDEHDLLPYVLISTIDGGLHAVDRDKGKILWSLTEGVEPLVGGGSMGEGLEEFIVEPLTGGLFLFEDDEGAESPKIRKLPLTVEQLIDISPFTFPQSPSRIFTGSKQTSLLTIDLRTGEQVDYFSNSNLNFSSRTCANDQMLDNMDRSTRSSRDTLFVGRTDYRLVIHSTPHRQSSPDATFSLSGRKDADEAEGVQEIVYSTYTPNTYDKALAEQWSKIGVDEKFWEADGSESKRVRVELKHDGFAVGIERGVGVKWTEKLSSVGIAVYDILLPLAHPSANPILVPQPPSSIRSVSAVNSDDGQRANVFGKAPSTFIASISSAYLSLPSTGSDSSPNQSDIGDDGVEVIAPRPLLYALSSDSYPLVNFAPPPQPGHLSGGSFVVSEDLPTPYLLDPPKENAVPAITDQEEKTPLEPSHLPDSGVESPSRKIIWSLVGLLASLSILGAFWFGKNRQTSVTTSNAIPDERTQLLVIEEKSAVVEKVDPVSKSLEPITVTSRPASDDSEADAIDTASKKETVNTAIKKKDDAEATPKKKTNRRRVRGKKKKDNQVSFAVASDDEEEDDDKTTVSSKSSSKASPPSTVLKKDEKPLPELPRVLEANDPVGPNDTQRLVISDEAIGRGSHGTVVFKGFWGARKVAVKRLLSEFTQIASQEVKLLQASDDHVNVIRYYCQEKRDNFLFIALDLCDASLADLVESPDRHQALAPLLDPKKALKEITSGVKHLHSMKIIHRDIKPQNVLVSKTKDGSLRMVVSDFGLARQLDQGQSSFAPTANNLAGSLGWRAPECIRGQVKLSDVMDPYSTSGSSFGSMTNLDNLLSDLAADLDVIRGMDKGHARLTKAVDIFALGCLYFWLLRNGEHPYGEAYDRESNIVRGDVVNMGHLDELWEEGVEAKELIGRMLSLDPSQRPDTSSCLIHPFFWTPAKRLAFLCDASDRFEIMELEPPEPTLVLLEDDAASVVGKDWYSRLDKVFTNNLGKYRKYKGNSVRDLLRAMRNKKHHYQDLEPVVKRHLGSLPIGFLHYFTSRYPKLFLHVHGVVRDSRLRHESMFEAYFADSA